MIKPKVIVVEDDRDLGDAIIDIFDMALDVDVELIGDGLKAQERFRLITPRLILLDMHLPKISGVDLLHQNIGNWRLAGVKILIMTADLMLLQQFQHMVDDSISKPFGIEKFVDTVRQLLDGPSQPAVADRPVVSKS
jgi:DNA-binding response OmpR family regulator